MKERREKSYPYCSYRMAATSTREWQAGEHNATNANTLSFLLTDIKYAKSDSTRFTVYNALRLVHFRKHLWK